MKRLLCLVIAFMMITSISVTAFADVYAEANGSEKHITFVNVDEPTRQEETVWYFRIYMGRHQMRLWSLTYERWLTEWIDIGPA
jgi:hypothetical protein